LLPPEEAIAAELVSAIAHDPDMLLAAGRQLHRLEKGGFG
jgi:hypothetical protein